MNKFKKACLGGSMLATLIATPFIVKWEGVKNKAYYDVVGVLTICAGETQGVKPGDYKTDQECEDMTRDRALEFAKAIDDMVDVEMGPKYHASLIIWSYNVGLGAAKRSTLVRKLNNGDYDGACRELIRKSYGSNGVCRGYGCGWAGGKQYRGLQNRRMDEYNLCMEGIEEMGIEAGR